jgi:hypothetical protein
MTHLKDARPSQVPSLEVSDGLDSVDEALRVGNAHPFEIDLIPHIHTVAAIKLPWRPPTLEYFLDLVKAVSKRPHATAFENLPHRVFRFCDPIERVSHKSLQAP